VANDDNLLQFVMDEELIPRGLPLVAGLTGFTDSGAAVSQFTEYILDVMKSKVVAVFDPDELLDYRARRPTIYFDQDHLTGYEPPRLAIHLVHDEMDRPFFLLSGYEPDFKWERFSRSVVAFIDDFDISDTTWVHAIPMPVPHTRPIGVTVSGNRRDLVESKSVWRPHTQVPSNAMHLVEYRLDTSGHDVCGFVLLVSNYLADTEFPNTALASLEFITSATGLLFPTDRLREEGREFIARIDEQLTTNEELAKMVRKLERRYDEYMKDNMPDEMLRSPLTDEEGALPSADEIAAELEAFLSSRRHHDDAPER
jgi:hypothetical protein